MIKLGKLTDYAIAVMGQLAHETADGALSARHVAERTGVPEPTVAKVLKLLSKGGLVAATRGAAGGYTLTKDAASFSLTEIIEALDGPVCIVSCADGNEEACALWHTCPTKSNWTRVNEAIRKALDGITLADMLVPSAITIAPPKAPAKDIDAHSA